jgi:hypothetical protein
MYGMIIEESLVDNRGLNDLRVTGVRITNAADLRDRWHIYSVEVTREQIDGLRKHLKPGTWYMHFWNKQDLVVIFSDKIFEMNLHDKMTWRPAIEYGISRGIPETQLDFLTE